MASPLPEKEGVKPSHAFVPAAVQPLERWLLDGSSMREEMSIPGKRLAVGGVKWCRVWFFCAGDVLGVGL